MVLTKSEEAKNLWKNVFPKTIFLFLKVVLIMWEQKTDRTKSTEHRKTKN